MPVTPFHFGPGAAIKAVIPNLFSLTAYMGANVLIDIETLYYMLTNQYPWHRFFHTYVGAGVITLAAILIMLLVGRVLKTFSIIPVWAQRELSLLPIVIGATLGASSHIVLDSIMHADIRPLAPFSDGNPLFRVIALAELHGFCLMAGGLGVLVWLVTRAYLRMPRP